jgi:hypothetical protein
VAGETHRTATLITITHTVKAQCTYCLLTIISTPF